MQLRAYFENFGSVLEAFVSYDRQSGRPRGFGFVVFESAEVAEKVVASKHMIDRREVSRLCPQVWSQDAVTGVHNLVFGIAAVLGMR